MTLNQLFDYLANWWWFCAGFGFVLAAISNAIEIRRRRKRRIM